jgi:DNA-binding LacI/PurR family transcriptional regulator
LVAAGEFNRKAAKASILKLIEGGIEMDGVFAGDDEAAVGVLAVLGKAGKRVPADVSVVGFDDQRLSAYLAPPLTTVRPPTERVGHEAVQQLLRLIRTGQAGRLILLPTGLVIRQSCGCGWGNNAGRFTREQP